MLKLHYILCSVFMVGCLIKELRGQQEPCTTAFGEQGRCKPLLSCASLAALVTKPTRSPQDIDVLRRSHCGFIGDAAAVCCPLNRPQPPPSRPPPSNQCATPDRTPGQCIDLYSCPHLVKLLQPPVSNENRQYVTNSRCNGPAKYSVCCGSVDPPPTPALTVPLQKTKCEVPVTAYPPDPNSGCCGVDTSFADKIVGGTEAAIDQYPWSVLIEYASYYDGSTKLYCGGSLISGRYVLTAAHCVVGRVAELGRPIKVRLGEHNTKNEGPDCKDGDCTKGAISIRIEKIIVHPVYNFSSTSRWSDIALIRLSSMAPYNEFIRPICLPKEDITLSRSASYNFTVAGWGATSNSTPSSPVKLYVDLPYVPREICQEAYSSRNATLSKGQLCAGGVEGKDSCKGDSGGALMLENFRRVDAVGVVSFGREYCGLNGVAAVYTNVYEHIDWITSNIST